MATRTKSMCMSTKLLVTLRFSYLTQATRASSLAPSLAHDEIAHGKRLLPRALSPMPACKSAVLGEDGNVLLRAPSETPRPRFPPGFPEGRGEYCVRLLVCHHHTT